MRRTQTSITLSFDSDDLGRRHLLPDKCPFETGIGAFWQLQQHLLPSCEEKPFELGNLCPPVGVSVAKMEAAANSLTEIQANLEASSGNGYIEHASDFESPDTKI
jgi:hypothetical protein